MIHLAVPKAIARLAFRISSVQAQVFRDSDDWTPTAEVCNIHHKGDVDAEAHSLLEREAIRKAPLLLTISTKSAQTVLQK